MNIEKITAKDLKNMCLSDFVKYTEKVIKTKPLDRVDKMSIKFPVALTCNIKDKLEMRHAVYRYTCLINNAGTLCHILSSDDDDLIIRIKLRHSVKHLSKKRQRIIIWSKLQSILNIGTCPY